MTMTELTRLITALRKAGWSGDEINDLMLYIESGDEKFAPKEKT